MSPPLEMLKGTLDLMVLQTLQAMGALHGYGMARRIEQISRDTILLNQGTMAKTKRQGCRRMRRSGRRWSGSEGEKS